MNRSKYIGPAVLALILAGGALSGCASTDSGQGIEAIEQMSELDYNRWSLYVQLGVKIGANRLLEEGVVTEDELEITAVALETIRDQDFVPAGSSLVQTALQDVGLTSDEIELLLLIVEQELTARGALDWVNPDTGMVELSDRTEALLTMVADALRSATLVTDTESEQGQVLEAEFQGKLIE